MKNFLCAALVAALILCASAQAGQYYSNANGGTRGYDEYARYPNAYECVSVDQAFVSVMHRSVRLKKSEGPRTKYTPTAFAVGYAHTMDKLQLGAAFNFEGGNRKLRYRNTGSGYKVSTNIPGISVFGTYRPFADGTYLSGSLFLGFANYKAKGAYVGGAHLGGTDKEHRNVFSLGLEAGRTWVFGQGFQVTPHIGLDVSYAPTERYRFAGPGDSIDSQGYWEIPLGVTLRKTFGFGSWLITPKADFTLATRVGGVSPKNAHPGFSYRVADKWKTVGASTDSFGARVTLGVDARFTDRWTFGVDYTYEGRSQYDDHRISASVGYAF